MTTEVNLCCKLVVVSSDPNTSPCDVALQDLDLEGEWDPESHDQQMAGLYGDDDIDVDEKPQWDDDIDIGDITDAEEHVISKTGKKKKKK